MTPTIEEVKKVAWNLRKSLPFGAPRDEVTLTDQQLQSFAQHYIEVGREQKAEEASELLNNLNRTISNMIAANAKDIRNNTGE